MSAFDRGNPADVRRESLLALARVNRKDARAQLKTARVLKDAGLRNALKDTAIVLFALAHAQESAAHGDPIPLQVLAEVNCGELFEECFTVAPGAESEVL